MIIFVGCVFVVALLGVAAMHGLFGPRIQAWSRKFMRCQEVYPKGLILRQCDEKLNHEGQHVHRGFKRYEW